MQPCDTSLVTVGEGEVTAFAAITEAAVPVTPKLVLNRFVILFVITRGPLLLLVNRLTKITNYTLSRFIRVFLSELFDIISRIILFEIFVIPVILK